jgi:D-beta-D-heptose 7-phosphate kinase/D-beta-D-heptose 1-phosphate adenosyltransferase
MGSPRNAAAKIKSAAALASIVRQAQARGRRAVFTNGCFDLLHTGHVTLLEQARRRGDLLIVAINSDRSVRAQRKGPGRPVVPQADRARVLAGLESVDYVTIFDEPTPLKVITRIKPRVLIKGADWGPGNIVGREVVERHGGRVVRLPLVKGRSTTDLIRRIQKAA